MGRVTLAGLLALTLTAHAHADTFPYKAVVVDSEVKVRSRPSGDADETGTLPRGTPLMVEGEESGWLAVTAPAGSVSWVQSSFVNNMDQGERTPRNVFVESDVEITVAAGRVGLDQPLNVRRAKVPQGTALVVIGPKVQFNGRTWYPITPPPGDVRYVPKTAVQFERAATTAFTVRVNEGPSAGPPATTPAGGPVASVPGPGLTPVSAGAPVAKPAVNHPLWAQAETAERENRLADAEKLFFQLAEEMNRPGGDHDIANLCYTRIHALREKQRVTRGGSAAPSGGTAITTGTTGSARPPAKDDRGVKVGTPEPLPPGATPGDRGGDRPDWHTGKLVVATITLPGMNQQLYMLEGVNGEVKFYLTGDSGVNLRNYIGRRVSVYGAPADKFGLKRPYLVATAVEAAR